MTQKYNFTFRPISWSYWNEYKDRDWVVQFYDNWKTRQKKQEKRDNRKNVRKYEIYKIEPVKQGNKNYTLVAFPIFTDGNNGGWGIEYLDYIGVRNGEMLKFIYQKNRENKNIKIPLFCLTSSFPFSEKSVGTTNFVELYGDKASEVLDKLTAEMAETDLILIAPINGYEINQVDEQEQTEPTEKKPDKTNHQCQAVHDKLQDWEVKAKAKILADCQNDNHAGYYSKAGVFAAPEYSQYTILTKKCACGGQLKGNSYGDKMTKCRIDCSEVEGDSDDSNKSGESTTSNDDSTTPKESKDKTPQKKNPTDDNVAQIRTNAKKNIQQLLKENNLKTLDLDSRFANWETDLEKLNNVSKIKEFQQQLEKEVQTQKDKKQSKSESKPNKRNFSWPVKLLIGGGMAVVLVMLIGYLGFSKRKRQENQG
jgi:hypothetical protein